MIIFPFTRPLLEYCLYNTWVSAGFQALEGIWRGFLRSSWKFPSRQFQRVSREFKNYIKWLTDLLMKSNTELMRWCRIWKLCKNLLFVPNVHFTVLNFLQTLLISIIFSLSSEIEFLQDISDPNINRNWLKCVSTICIYYKYVVVHHIDSQDCCQDPVSILNKVCYF